MSRKRKARRSIPKLLLLWAGRRMLGRVQKRSLRSITERPKPKRFRLPAVPGRVRASESAPKRALRLPQLPRKSVAGIPVEQPVPSRPHRRVNRAKAGKGIAAAVLTTAAVAALKYGADRVIEAERDQHVVTPDFDVFSDDDE